MPVSFPNDVNGDVLRRMQEHGVDFTQPRQIDFAVVLPSEDAAEAFAEQIRELGYSISIARSGCVFELPWDAKIERTMIPSHAEITEFESTLADLAERFGGRNDGWGSLT